MTVNKILCLNIFKKQQSEEDIECETFQSYYDESKIKDGLIDLMMVSVIFFIFKTAENKESPFYKQVKSRQINYVICFLRKQSIYDEILTPKLQDQM